MNAKSVLMRAVTAAAGVSVAGAAYAAGRASTRPALTAARRLARTDALTGVVNRAGLDAELTRRAAGRQPWALLLVDLDDFKQVNDTHGHAAGDAVLAEAARRLTGVCDPAVDLVARLGGDEFVVVASCPAPVFAWLLGRDVAAALRRPVAVTTRPASSPVLVEVSASVGVVSAVGGDDPRAVLHSADVALYAAKIRGRGQIVEFDPAAALADIVAQRPAVRLRDLTDAGRHLAGVQR